MASLAKGNVNVETNGGDNARSASYTYDALNRVSTAQSQASSGSDCWGQSFSYDRYANLTTISATQCSAPMLSLSVNTNNQITSSGFSYDALNRLTKESYSDGAATVTYGYDSSACLGQPTSYNVGRRTSMSDGAGSESWSYD